MNTQRVIVRGGGPAGAEAAFLLSTSGVTTLLVHRDEARALPIETLVPAAAKALLERGLAPLFARERWFGAPHQGVIWGSPTLRVRHELPETRGFQVHRQTFDLALRARAVAAGAELATYASAFPDTLEIIAVGRHPTSEFAKVAHSLPETIALSAQVRQKISDLSETTVIEAVPEGWIWSVPHRDAVTITVFLDAEDVRHRGKSELFRAALNSARGPAHGAATEPERGADVTAKLRAPVRERILLAGDAASALDPLSSQGIEKALASATHAAICARTILKHPELTDAVSEYRQLWELGLFDGHTLETLSTYAEEQRFVGQLFWDRRHTAWTALAATASTPLPPSFRPSSAIRTATALRLQGDLLEPVPGFRIEGKVGVIEAVHGLPVAALLEICTPRADRAAAFERCRTHPVLFIHSPGIIERALFELWRRNFLVQD